jgi:hypothetical protein
MRAEKERVGVKRMVLDKAIDASKPLSDAIYYFFDVTLKTM